MAQVSLQIWEGSNKGTGRLKVRQEGRCGQTRGYTLEEIAGLQFNPASFVEYCEMSVWNPDNLMDIAFISRSEGTRFRTYYKFWQERGINYNKDEFEPFYCMKESSGLYPTSDYFWKGAFLHKKTATIWFFQGFLPKEGEDVEKILDEDKKVYKTDSGGYRVLKNCSMQASKKFWIGLKKKAEEYI